MTMWEGAVLIFAGVALGFVGGCVGCAEVFFWAGARAARWAYRAGRLDAAREEDGPEYVEELLPPGPGVPEDRAEEVMKRVRGKDET